jgi:Cof subfamily protein (haloacid dehalogenase superfamily)
MVGHMTTTPDRETIVPRRPGGKISAVISDVDGTLVADDKSLPEANRRAVAKLTEAGIAFALISSRPPRGMGAVIKALNVPLVFAGFNGGVISTAENQILEQHLLGPDLARRTVQSLAGDGVDVWVFSGQQWFVQNTNSPYVPLETRTVGFECTIVRDFGVALDTAGKIVGVSADAALLGHSEAALRAELADHATIVRSQRYYLDITHSLANKGAGVRSIAKHLDVPLEEIAVIGDGPNDVVMFEAGGLSIAMGNAEPAVQQAANYVTGANNAAGFAEAMERFILADRGA